MQYTMWPGKTIIYAVLYKQIEHLFSVMNIVNIFILWFKKIYKLSETFFFSSQSILYLLVYIFNLAQFALFQ